MFVAPFMTILAICIVQPPPPPPPPTGDKPERNGPREDECEVINLCSTARSFLLSLSFLFSFHPLSEIGKIHLFLRP